MKLLVISARYPPYHFGGYELRCKNIMDALASRGYSICVLTSQREAAKDLQVEGTSPNEYPVYRRLHLGRLGGWIDRLTLRRWTYLLGMALVFARDLWIDWADTAFVGQQIRQFRPDVIYLGHVTAFSRALLYLSEWTFR